MKNYSYVTLLTNDSYAYGVTLLVESMKQVKTKYPLHVLIIDEVSAATRQMLSELGVSYEIVDVIPTPATIYEHNIKINPGIASTWRHCWTKFQVFGLTQFEKIVFLDADIMLCKNIDNLFKMTKGTAAVDGEYFGLWSDSHFNAGCMVIEPAQEEFDNLLKFANSLNIDNLPLQIIADQEVLNMYYKDWPRQKHLHLDKYYNIFAPYIQETQLEDLKDKVQFIHFIGRKPWQFWMKDPREIYSEHYYTIAKEIVENKIKTLDWKTIRSNIVLTVYGICKNEIESVENYLNSFSEADYVCLLDTGSTDGTWEYLKEAQKKYPNLIINQKEIKPWRFDMARNESMKLIPKETTMFFMADLDEVIKEKGWSQKVKDVWEPLFDRAQYTYNREVKENDNVTKAIQEYRIHSKDWYKWINIVHEALINHAGRKQFLVQTCTPVDITVWHYPKKKGQTNYMELCEQDLKENPEDWIMRLQLAIEYEIREELEKAYEHFNIIISTPNSLQPFEVARSYFGIGRYWLIKNDVKKALFYFSEGRIIDPFTADNYLAAAETYYNHKHFDEASELCRAAFKNCMNANWCAVFDIQSYYPYWLLGMCYYFMNQKDKALGYLTIASIKNSSDEIEKIKNEIATQICGEWRNDLSLN